MNRLFSDRQNYWHVIFGAAFIALSYVLWRLSGQRNIDFFQLSVFDLAILFLATFRMIRLFTYDYITKFFRDYIEQYQKGFLREVADMCECPWCSGIWMALLAGYLYIFPFTKLILFLLAISGAGTFIQILIWKIGLEPGEENNK